MNIQHHAHRRPHRTRPRRLAAAALAPALALAALVAPGGGAVAAPAAQPAAGGVTPGGAAASWLSAQLPDGVASYSTDYGDFEDIGLTIDAGRGFASLGRTADVERVADAVAAKVKGYAYGDEYAWEAPYAFTQVGYYAGPLAKTLVWAQTAGRDATAYGGIDLVAAVEERTQPSGRIVDDSSYGDYANVIGQSFAARGLTRAGSPEAGAAVSFLLEQQCAPGYFRLYFSDAADAEQGCVVGAVGSAADMDATSLAVIELSAAGVTDPAQVAQLDAAAAWLVSQQKSDGSFGGGATTTGPNSNSTGLAAAAVAARGHATAAARAAVWLRRQQVDLHGACATSLAAHNGAVAYDAQALETARTGGITPAARGVWLRATAQAVIGLAYAPTSTTAPSLAAPVTAVEGSRVDVRVTGLAEGQTACLSLGGDIRSLTGTGQDVIVSFDLPAGAGERTFALATLEGTATAVTTATTAPTPPVAPETTPALGTLLVKKVTPVRKGVFRVKVACPATKSCAGSLVVRTVGKVRAGSQRRVLVVGKRSYRVVSGRTTTLRVTVTRPARTALRPGRVLKVKAVQKAPGLSGAVTRFRLRAGRAR